MVNATQTKRSEKTINKIVNCVIGIYDCMTKKEYLDKDVKSALTKEIKTNNKTYTSSG
ncbi:hypothetical protein MOB71_11135 [Bacillus spizizenii]|uniref:Uncharacterized protein n=1 Tax=Bacillus spizizenii (strain ATCC 23059 / NRRL B-14472 / W23) TaxID=655816 RepID=E0TYW4_BACSH|nr:hypothetical protein [Bacillus spizizenii]ADM38071.1 hypothetical protein BSUW23_10135 [Bacillus spizizenii str. W23]EFG93274.1 hypothetical protein BSU6633_05389 [Bacillus spizizenii ATCC 6633 = JCM 2499]MCY7884752.1 hypothetical protein [Bacillus spizizenii]MCY7996599.1 hypothetical protein [Bacillus spizizenii]MCY8042708.1 hypothetical protein [Bacillus spizizenii]